MSKYGLSKDRRLKTHPIRIPQNPIDKHIWRNLLHRSSWSVHVGKCIFENLTKIQLKIRLPAGQRDAVHPQPGSFARSAKTLPVGLRSDRARLRRNLVEVL